MGETRRRAGAGSDAQVGGIVLGSESPTPPRGGARLTNHAYHLVRSRVLSGALRAGTVLPETTVAEELGISKTPVRQALRALLQEGLLEVGPRRQLMVSRVSVEHRQELLHVREALERIAVAQACHVMSVDEIDHLRILLRRQKRAAEANDEETFIDLDEELHLAIAAGARLRVVPRLLSQLRGFVRLMRLGTVRYQGHLHQVVDEHEAIVDALERGDEAGALEALALHLHKSEYVRRPAATLVDRGQGSGPVGASARGPGSSHSP
jgi:DNA-binding GntR family transcriptional regulator